MDTLIILLLMLLGVSHGIETDCDGRQNGAQCYGALGGTVVLRLMDSTSGISRYQWLKNNSVILSGIENRILTNLTKHRYLFTPSNGTFRIDSLSRTDGGEYILQMFDSDGKSLQPQTLQLTIEAPVSYVRLVSECLSQGEMKVSCSSEGGDSPQYSWTLDGRTLTGAQLLSGNIESQDITLKQQVSGQLVCSVRNHISSVSKLEWISTCGFIFIDCTLPNGTNVSQWVFEANNTLCIEPTPTPTTKGKETTVSVTIKPSTNITSFNQTSSSTDEPFYVRYLPLIVGVLCALVFFLLVCGVVVVCLHKKKKNNITQEEQDEQDEQELTYADVTIVQKHARQMQRRAEMEVEYGQVKFSERPQQTVEPTQDNCVYAKVYKHR